MKPSLKLKKLLLLLPLMAANFAWGQTDFISNSGAVKPYEINSTTQSIQGVTVYELFNDLTINENLTLSNPIIVTGERTINMSGQTITRDAAQACFILDENAKLTITGYGTFDGNGNSISSTLPFIMMKEKSSDPLTNAVGGEAQLDIEGSADNHIVFQNFTQQTDNSSLYGAVICIQLTISDSNSSISRCKFIGNNGNEKGAIFIGSNLATPSMSHVHISDCEFDDNSADEGGAINLGNMDLYSDIRIMNCKFGVNGANTANIDGGAMYIDKSSNSGSTVQITKCHFENNTAEGNGGGVYVASGQITIEESLFQQNAAEENGGGVYVSGRCIIKKATISNNTALSGGGVYVDEYGELVFRDVSNNLIQYNEATHGGGIYNNGEISYDRGTFTVQNNTATNGGGVYANNSTLLTNATISTNTASQKGGGVFVASTGSIQFTGANNLIQYNTANGSGSDDGGGGIYCIGNIFPYPNANNPSIKVQNNQAPNGYGGGVYVGMACNIMNNTITGNTATNGGGVYVNFSGIGTCTLNGTSVSNNTANTNGGGVYVNRGTCTLNGTSVSNNTANTNGGGVYVNIGTCTLNGATISNNTANTYGGGVYVKSTLACSGTNNLIQYNEATDGGGVYVASNGTNTCTLSGTTISNNTANTNGGGVYVNGTLTFSGTNNRIQYNEATNGGGVYVNTSNHTLSGATISNNTASTNGGGVYVSTGTHTINGATISDNTANTNGGGVYIDGSSRANFENGTVSNNSAGSFGGGVYISTNAIMGAQGALKVRNNTTKRNGTTYELYLNDQRHDDVCLQTLNNATTSTTVGTGGNVGKIHINGDLTGAKIGITEEQVASGQYRNEHTAAGHTIRQFTMGYESAGGRTFDSTVFISNDRLMPIYLLRHNVTLNETGATTTTTGQLEVTLGTKTEVADPVKFYVAGIVDDGGFQWGKDDPAFGRYPDLPLRTLTGPQGVFARGYRPGIDYIYVVRAVSIKQEYLVRNTSNPQRVVLRYPEGATPADFQKENTSWQVPEPANAYDGHKMVTLYRYPGGHELSDNFEYASHDEGNGNTNFNGNDSHGYCPSAQVNGHINQDLFPGPNYGPLLVMDSESNAKVYGIILDGLKEYDNVYDEYHNPIYAVLHTHNPINPKSPLLVVNEKAYADSNADSWGTESTGTITLVDKCILKNNHNKDGNTNNTNSTDVQFPGNTAINPTGYTGGVKAQREMRPGGGIYNAGRLVMQGACVADNVTKKYGGGVYTTGPTSFTHTIVTNNRVETDPATQTPTSSELFAGGGIYYYDNYDNNATLSLTNSEVSNNVCIAHKYPGITENYVGTPIVYGGGIYVEHGNVTISNSMVNNNFAMGQGGGIYINKNAGTLTIEEGSEVNGNQTTSQTYTPQSGSQFQMYGNLHGGGILFDGTTLRIDGSNINENGSTEYVGSAAGVGVAVEQGEATISNCLISSNKGRTSSGGLGGAGVYVREDATLIMTDTKVTDNKFETDPEGDWGLISNGTGLFLSGAAALTNCTITGNTGNNTDGGGIFCNASSKSVTIDNCTIANNRVENLGGNDYGNGGGLYLHTGTVNITNSHIGLEGEENTASGHGGGIYIENGAIAILEGGDTIQYNTASGQGGGIYIQKSSYSSTYYATAQLKGSGNIIQNNTANGKGGGVYKDGSLKVEGTPTITNNKAGTAKAVVTENVYIPAGSADEQTILITGELDCGSKIGVTKTKKWSGTPKYGDINGDGTVDDSDNGDHTYEDDDHADKVGHEVRTAIAKVSSTNTSETWALDAFRMDVFFDDKDNYQAWCFNYNPNNATTAYSDQKNYFIETWRCYADSGNSHVATTTVTQSGETTTHVKQVKSAQGLAYLAKLVNSGKETKHVWIDQVADIDLTGHYWEPIGYGSRTGDADYICVSPTFKFENHYDGRGHLITNAFSILPLQYLGIFGHVFNSSIIRTFALESDFTLTREKRYGAISSNAAGGIAGYLESRADEVNTKTLAMLDQCEASSRFIQYDHGTGTNDATIGGLVGMAASLGSFAWAKSHGSAGQQKAATRLAECFIRNSFATPNITIITTKSHAGGLVGLSEAWYDGTNLIENNYSNATLNGPEEAAKGTLIGKAISWERDGYTTTHKLQNCYTHNLGKTGGAIQGTLTVNNVFKPEGASKQYYPQSGTKAGRYDFETEGLGSEWVNDTKYPWKRQEAGTIYGQSISANGGSYFLMSGNARVNNSTSTIEMQVYASAGATLEFYYGVYGEESSDNGTLYDYGTFYIDGTEEFKTAAVAAWNSYSNTLSEGVHTLKWTYEKDVSTDYDGDCFIIDDLKLTNAIAFSEPYTGTYTPCIGADYLGYMRADNLVVTNQATGTTSKPLFAKLNTWVNQQNKANNDLAYANWARPGLAYYVGDNENRYTGIERPINADLPVLRLSESSKRPVETDGGLTHATENTNVRYYQGDFRSVGTYGGPGTVLQYGGPARDGDELYAALTRPKADSSKEDNLFIYGDNITEIPDNGDITQAKVSIFEHAAILNPGKLATFPETYVSVTANKGGGLKSTIGINDMAEQNLPRSWHMLSSTLTNAPLGFDYKGTNNGKYSGPDYESNNEPTYDASFSNKPAAPVGPTTGTTQSSTDFEYWNNPWHNGGTAYANHHGGVEFHWLGNTGNIATSSTNNKRYWMKGWENSQDLNGNIGIYPHNTDDGATTGDDGIKTYNAWADGYMPSNLSNLHTFNHEAIGASDEKHRYPYGMDFYSWYEATQHYINFKRNGPNHWHSDAHPSSWHFHMAYTPEVGGTQNVNEETLIPGKGYMMTIGAMTYLQSHGNLQADEVTFPLTYTPNEINIIPGYNLVGNPYHGYLDLEKLGTPVTVIQNNAFMNYPPNGSQGGAYANQYQHPHQGFFVQAAGNGNLTFNQTMVVPRHEAQKTSDNATPNLRSNDDTRPTYPLVNLFLSSAKGCSDICVVELRRPEWGGAEKMKHLYMGNGQFYAKHDDKQYAALFATEEASRIPIQFEPKDEQGDTYTISWTTANADFEKLILVDNMTGVQYDMLADTSYSFTGKKGDYWSRFYITFSVTGVEEQEEELDDDTSSGAVSFAFFDGSQWVVTNALGTANGATRIDLIDLQGRVLHSTTIGNDGQTRLGLPNVAKGMYLLRMTNSNGMKVQKIIVQ